MNALELRCRLVFALALGSALALGAGPQLGCATEGEPPPPDLVTAASEPAAEASAPGEQVVPARESPVSETVSQEPTMPAEDPREIAVDSIRLWGPSAGEPARGELVVPDRDPRLDFGEPLRRYDRHVARLIELTAYWCGTNAVEVDDSASKLRMQWIYRARGGRLFLGRFSLSCSLAVGALESYGRGAPVVLQLDSGSGTRTATVPTLRLDDAARASDFRKLVEDLRPRCAGALCPGCVEGGSPASSAASGRFRGMLVLGHEVRSFRACESDREVWVVDFSGELDDVRARLTSAPSQPMYVEVRGCLGPAPREGFGADYPEQLAVSELRHAAVETAGCGEARGAAELRAYGNEPFWYLEIARDGLAFSSLDREGLLVFPYVEPDRSEGRRAYVSSTAGSADHQLELVVEERRCIDTMSGTHFAFTVALELDGRHYEGCAKEGWP